MPLFQHSILKKFLGELDVVNLEAAWEKFQKHFHNRIIQQNILKAKEEEYQEGFVRDLFVNVLGYTLKPQPDYNLVLEKKSTGDATKSDGAILSAEGNVIAVIELKDTGTADLSKVERQAFGYKHQHKDCRYIITSNFLQLRFYINDAIDYEAFDLFRLDKNSFSLLYCLLQQKALQNDVPLRMKQQSVAAEENVTKKLYDDYSRFKKLLFENITQQNAKYEKLLLFKKTQKLLDRFLFILFAEDRGLVPPNSVRGILQQWEQLKELDNYVPLYERFKKFFGYLDTGYSGKQYEIFAYNGGLFAPDEILDNIRIDDELLYEGCKGLSNYDFESEVDVNILGHIFEHSLNETEEIEQKLTAGEITEKKTSKRKKDGVFYTPRYITKYIVENTVGALCIQKRKELEIKDEDFVPQKRKSGTEELFAKLEFYREWLLQISICDPACGSGAFLNQALEFLIAEHQSIDILQAKLFGDAITFTDVQDTILETNLYGVDINEEAVEIAKLSLWLRTAQKGRMLNSLSNNIKCGNSLIDDPSIAGAKAFNWEKEFPTIFSSKRQYFLDSIQEFKEIVDEHKRTPEENDEVFKELDKTHLPAIEKMYGAPVTNIKEYIKAALTLLHHPQKPKMMWLGLLERDPLTSQLLMEFAKNNGIPIETVFEVIIENFMHDLEVNFDDYADIFTPGGSIGFDVVIGNPPYVNSKGEMHNESFKKYWLSKYKTAVYQIDTYLLFIELGLRIINKNGIQSFIIPNAWLNNVFMDRIRRFVLAETAIIAITKTPRNTFVDANVDTVILTLKNYKKENSISFYELFSGSIKFIGEKNQDSFLMDKENLLVFRGNEKFEHILEKIQEGTMKLSAILSIARGVGLYHKRVGHTKQFIEQDPFFSETIKDDNFVPYLRGKNINRYNVIWNNNSYVSYGNWLAEPRQPKYFEGERILLRQIPGNNNLYCTYIANKFIVDQSVFIGRNEGSEYQTKYLCAIINSKLIAWYFRNKYSEFDELFPKIKLSHFKDFPIKYANKEQQLPFIAKADIMLSKNKELQSIKQQILQLLSSKFEGITITKKLQDWPSLSFSQFLKELDKQKIKLSLSAQAEWMQYFETEKSKANTIQQLINKTDKEIDEMVYELYGLTEEERKVVEG